MEKYNSRKDVPEKYKWDLSDFFKDDKDYEEKFDVATKLIKELANYKNCTKDANKLYKYLEKEMNAFALCQNLYVYAYLLNDQELGIAENIERKNKAIKLLTDLEKNTSFFSDELLGLSLKEYNDLFIKNKKLYEYKAALDQIYKDKGHILSPETENIITDLINATNHFEDISSTMLNSEHNYGTIRFDDGRVEQIQKNNYRLFLKNENERIRKEAFISFNDKIDEYSKTSAALLNSYVSMKNTNAKIHNFDSSWQQNLHKLDLSDKVFTTLVDAAYDNLDSLHRYYKLKKKALNLDILNSYDLNLNMVKNDKEYTIEEAQEIIRKSLSPLGEEYLSKFDKIINNKYIDYCQYQGKCSGGYSFSTRLNDSRILMSYNYDLISVSTIAHEAGHNINHQYIKENNKIQYNATYPIVAEVASLTNECLLSSYLADNGTTKDEKLAGLENIMEVFISNFYGAVREGKIETDMYDKSLNGGTITKDYLDKLTLDSLSKYYGSEIKYDEKSKNSWVSRSHYYMNFYLYSYAICVSVATNVASKILGGDKEFLDKYIEFLKIGSDKNPKEAFEVLGINLEDKEVYETAIKYFDSLINKYNQILDKE